MLQNLARLVLMRIEAMRSMQYLDLLTLLPNRHRFVADLAAEAREEDTGHGTAVTAVAIDVCGADYAR